MPEWQPFLGPFHSVLLHFPIGFLTLTFILELYPIRRPSQDLRAVATLTMTISVVAVVVVAMFGMWRASAGGYDDTILRVHQWSGLSVAVLTLATAAAQRVAFRNQKELVPAVVYRGLFGCTLIGLVIAGHYGGTLTHGSRYLVKNAPDALKAWLVGDPTDEASRENSSRLFIEDIQPMLEDRCITCHGPEKQMGDLRLDQGASVQLRPERQGCDRTRRANAE